jgi:tryptophan halogenase
MGIGFESQHRFPGTVGVVGGGTAGYFAALALKSRFPDLDVTLIESSSIPIIGVGEATTTLMPPFLHLDLGLDIVDLFRVVRPTFKLGIKFEWGPAGRGGFTYPFGEARPLDAFVFDGHIRAQSLTSLLMAGDRGPVVRGTDGSPLSLLPDIKFAYHLENRSFVSYLAQAAAEAGIHHLDATIATVRAGAQGVGSLHTSDGRELRFDLYVDASGFRSLLVGAALESPFESFGSTLFCDRAIVATVPQPGPVRPYTTAETMDAGWCWRIPVGGEDHRGYVHASALLDEDAAVSEMRAKNPGMGEPSVVRFRSGRHRHFWLGNTVAVGNAYGFVEPLESTALHMVIIELAYLLEALEARREGRDEEAVQDRATQAIGAHWDYLRWFLGVHYRYNRRLDTPFWRAARTQVDVSGLADVLDRFRREGPWLEANVKGFDVGDPAFGYSGMMMLMLGQEVEGCHHARSTMGREAWRAMMARNDAVASSALPQEAALEALRANPAMLYDFVRSRSSWIHAESRHPRELADEGRGQHG